MESLGKRLKIIRKHLGVKQEELARLLFTETSRIKNLETNRIKKLTENEIETIKETLPLFVEALACVRRWTNV